MTEIAVLAAGVIVLVVLCATFRPESADAIAKALRALAAVFAAAWPWKR